MQRRFNDGSGTELMIQLHGPLHGVVQYDGYYLAHLTHPLPCLCADTFNRKRRVVDAIVGWCRTVRVGTAVNDMNIFARHEGEYYSPGHVVEDGLPMPCIWLA